MKVFSVILLLIFMITALPLTVIADEQETINNNQQQAEDLNERLKYTGLIIPDHVIKRFEELDKLTPPLLLSTEDIFDWRTMGGVTPVKNQGNCGSCWDFAATGAFESAILINDGIELDLSEQQVLSCNSGGSDCDGGWMDDAYDVFMGYGAVDESCMPYAANDGVPCTQFQCESVARLTNVIDIPNNINSIKNALLDGPVSTTFMVWGDFHWDCYWHIDTGELNHAIVIVGWDDNMCSGQGAWIVKNSWGTWHGDNGYDYIPYNSCGIGRYAQQPAYEGTILLSFTYPDGLPDFIYANGGTVVRVEVEGNAGEPMLNSGMMYYNIGSGWVPQIMDMISPDVYEVTFPFCDCGSEVLYYFKAKTDENEQVNDPADAPTKTFSTISAYDMAIVFEDNFDTDQGWTVVNSFNFIDGAWERGTPIGGGDRGDPLNDYDGSGYCFLTDNVDGNSDVDGGYTFLISPSFDLSEGNAIVNYALWYTNNDGYDPNNDLFRVFVSNNNGLNWTHIETFGPVSSLGWTEHSFVIDNFVTTSNQVKIRFEVSDVGDGSIVEAGIDNVSIVMIDCDWPGYAFLPGDVNMFNGDWPPRVIGSDITYLTNYFRGMNTCKPCLINGFWLGADVNGDCIIIGNDITRLINYLSGSDSILYCPDHKPLWLSPNVLPVEIPYNWPNCETSVLSEDDSVIPASSSD